MKRWARAATLEARLGLRARTIEAAILGYPKSGNTWLGAMLRKALVVAYGLDESCMSRVFVSDPGRRETLLLPWRAAGIPRRMPRIVQGHALPFPQEPGLRGTAEEVARYRGKPMLVLVRDPRDVIVSSFMHEVYRAPTPRFQGDIDAFAFDPVFGIGRIIDYYSLLFRLRETQPGESLILRYEDMHADAKAALTHVLAFVGAEGVDERVLQSAFDYGSIENMRRIELSHRHGQSPVPGLFRSRNEGPESLKVREGKIGSHRSYLKPDTSRRIVELVEGSRLALLAPEALADGSACA